MLLTTVNHKKRREQNQSHLPIRKVTIKYIKQSTQIIKDNLHTLKIYM
jgi:hypothetical protein